MGWPGSWCLRSVTPTCPLAQWVDGLSRAAWGLGAAAHWEALWGGSCLHEARGRQGRRAGPSTLWVWLGRPPLHFEGKQDCAPGFPGGSDGKESACDIPWRREWLPIPVFLPGKSHGQRWLAGCRPWGRKVSERTELLTLPGLCPRPALLFLDCSSLISAFLPFPN